MRWLLVLLIGCAAPEPPCEYTVIPTPGTYSWEEIEAMPDDPTLEKVPCDQVEDWFDAE